MEAAAEARVQRLADAHCLDHQLQWLRRAVLLLPMDGLWAVLALQAGQRWAWVAPWLAVRAGLYLIARRMSTSLRPWIKQDPARGLVLTRRLYRAFGAWQALMFPTYFWGTDDLTKVLAMLLAMSYTGTVVVSASGQQRTFWWTVGPVTLVMLGGWALRGGWLGWIIVAMLLGSIPMTVIALRQQRRAWEDLMRLNEQKQRLASELALQRDRAELASAARTRFFAAASHDLRQPLHALAVNATTLDLLARQASDERLRDLSRDIGRALQQSQGLLDALLDVSRLDAGAVRVHLADVDVGALMQALHESFRPLAAQRGLGFVLSMPAMPVWARTDADQLQRIVRNLLDNAFKFTDTGMVAMALARLPTVPDTAAQLLIAVADTGIGIAPGERDKVFEEFYQAANPTRDRSRGLGLGLAIVRRTAALLGAEVQWRPQAQGPGTVFELRLSGLIDPPRTAAAVAPAPVPAPASLSVMVVDDEPDIVRAVTGLLHVQGWQALAADGPAGAMDLADRTHPPVDAAVIDHRLPGMTGVELALQVRARLPGLPILVLTGDVSVQWAVRRHGLPVLHKPLDGAALTQAIAAQVQAAARWARRLDVFCPPDGGLPMNLVDALHGRRSVRAYRPEPVRRDVIADLIWHAVQVPRPPVSHEASWAFHVIEGRDRLADFGERAKAWAAGHPPPGAPWSWPAQGDFEVFWGAPAAVLICARQGHPEAPFDACRAGQNLALAAHARGLGSCWIGAALPWLNGPEGREAAQVPEGFDVAVVLAVGHPAAMQPGRSAAAPAISWLA